MTIKAKNLGATFAMRRRYVGSGLLPSKSGRKPSRGRPFMRGRERETDDHAKHGMAGSQGNNISNPGYLPRVKMGTSP